MQFQIPFQKSLSPIEITFDLIIYVAKKPTKSLKIKNLTGTKFVLQELPSLYIEFSQVDKFTFMYIHDLNTINLHLTLILLCRRNSLPSLIRNK